MVLLPSRSAEHFEAFRSVLKHFEALQIGRNTPAITAHNYPWRRRDQNFDRPPWVFMCITAAAIADRLASAASVRGVWRSKMLVFC
jgi:hypothetical protein